MVTNLCVSRIVFAAKCTQAAMLAALFLSILACADKRVVLVPAPNATLASQPNSAQASNQGVSVLVQTNAWDDYPRHLEAQLVPIKIVIQNHSGHDLAIRYNSFALICRNNCRINDIPPYQIRTYDYEHLEPRWAYSDAYHAQVRLPTESMLREALAEGIINDGGEISGFLYFPWPTHPSPAITFQAVWIDAGTHQKFGETVIPLSLKWL